MIMMLFGAEGVKISRINLNDHIAHSSKTTSFDTTSFDAGIKTTQLTYLKMFSTSSRNDE